MAPRFVCRPILPVAGANIAGPGSAGKTTAMLGEKVRVTCGGELYGHPIEAQGTCVLVTAEDGADYARYVLQQILRDGIDCGQLTERAAARAKSDVRIIGWHRATYGPIVDVDSLGAMRRAPVYDLLLELIATVKPVYVTLDPAVLFGAGERYHNDGDAFLAAMLHESALKLGACIQLVDHVSQSVATSGAVHQHAARGGTAKTDNARLARQLVRVTPEAAADLNVPPSITDEEITSGRVLRLHWTKSNYAPLPPPAWLRRRRFWIEHVRAPSADESAAHAHEERSQQSLGDAATVVEYVTGQLGVGDGIRFSQRDLEEARPSLSDGQPMPRARVRDAVRLAVATGLLRRFELPVEERRGQRKHYLAPANHVPAPMPESAPEDAA
jgi:RecA-family ATPase